MAIGRQADAYRQILEQPRHIGIGIVRTMTKLRDRALRIKEYRGLSNKEGQPGPKTYYYRADFPGFFCCHTFWTFWEGNSNFKK